MSTEVDRLERVQKALDKVLTKMRAGTADRPKQVAKIDVALAHAHQWPSTQGPSRDSSRGGSSHPTAIDEIAEARRVHSLALRAAMRIPVIAYQMDKLARELDDTVARMTSVVDHGQLPDPPGCRSCARTGEANGRPIGGHFASVREDVKSKGLCSWCYLHSLEDGQLPPVELCHMFHVVSKRKAGVEMAKLHAARVPRVDEVPPACASEYTHLARTVKCYLGVGHASEHASLVDGVRVSWPNMANVA